MNKLQLSRLLMIATIILIAGFQAYWLTQLYKDEKQGLKKEADILFREAVYKLQVQKLSKDSLFRKLGPSNFLLKIVAAGSGMINKQTDSMSFTFNESVRKDSKDSTIKGRIVKDQIFVSKTRPFDGKGPIFIRSTFGDSLSVDQLDSSYRQELKQAKVDIGFTISRETIKGNPEHFMDSVGANELKTNYSLVAFGRVAYQASLTDTAPYLLGKITYPILISFLLIALTTASFIFLYRNLVAQRRLTGIKNDFISNITHELKTPIATVNVAIEALKSFNAMENPERTKEYLDISSSELQRLSLLVDKVLKLSMFENQDVQLKIEAFNLKDLVTEVIQTMQLQFNKAKATVNFETEGHNFIIEADKLHITSVIYNLLDNALKYSPVDPQINVQLIDKTAFIQIRVSDKGIGIPQEYQDKIFDKFFRVPHGNKHNIKGYGLGLSYVSHIIKKHHGYITVDSEEGEGSTFVVNLPFKESAVVDLGDGKKMRKEFSRKN